MKKVVLAGVMAVALSGCASIVSDNQYSVVINSSPDGADFEIVNRDGFKVESGKTPATVVLRAGAGFFKGETYTINLTKEGYQPKTFTVDSTLDGWYVGNVLIGGLVGLLIVDPATGAMFSLPDRVDISLDDNVASSSEKTLTISTIDTLTEAQRKQLQRIN